MIEPNYEKYDLKFKMNLQWQNLPIIHYLPHLWFKNTKLPLKKLTIKGFPISSSIKNAPKFP
jgi:hypothetical protein